MKLHYFEEGEAPDSDLELAAAKQQGYVTERCLLAGIVVMNDVRQGKDPCAGCFCDRVKCGGRRRQRRGGRPPIQAPIQAPVGPDLDLDPDAVADVKSKDASDGVPVRKYTTPQERWNSNTEEET